MSLKIVTFTGADDMTSIETMLAISEEHAFVEWGILLPHIGKPRFPSRAWVQRLIGAQVLAPHSMLIAAHVCPPLTAELIGGTKTIMDIVGSGFMRIQVNTHAEHYVWPDTWLERFAQDIDRDYVLQLDGVTGSEAYQHARDEGVEEILGLHDLSHGKGVLNPAWPASNGEQLIGYAGGLGPENLAEQLPRIAAAAGAADFWIDMETHIRTGSHFDLEKVKDCIRIAKPYIQT